MSNTVPAQHPAVVLRSSYQHLRALLSVAVAVIVGLTVAVVVLAINTGSSTTAQPAARATASPAQVNIAPAVTPNPDELGIQLATAQGGSVSGYPGHF